VETGFHSRDLTLAQYDYLVITVTHARFWGQQR